MGVVLKAVHRRLKRAEALKVVRLDKLGRPGAVQRFLREMEAAGRLNHPNIVTAYGAGEVGGIPYLAMEYVAGCDLGRLVQDHGPLPWREACRITYEVALALESADQRGIVHRDLKPSNILLTDQGVAKVADLGLAKFRREKAADPQTSEEGVVGTIDYVAPEQLDPSRRVDIRADIYSLGCTLYFMLAGRPPFGGSEYDSVPRKLKAHAEVVPPPIRALRGEVPADVSQILARMLEKQPEQRHANARTLAEEIRPFGEGANVSRLVSGVPKQEPQRPADVATTLTRAATGTHRSKVSAGLRRLVWWGAAAVLAALVIVGAALVWRAINPRELCYEHLRPEQIELGKWYPLLNEPTQLIGPPGGPTIRPVLLANPQQRGMHLSTQQGAIFLALGTIYHDGFTWQVDVLRSDWLQGTVGVFLGYQDTDGGAEAHCQTFEVQRQKSQGQWQLVLTRTERAFKKEGDRLVEGTTRAVYSERIATAGYDPVSLEIHVVKGRVVRVRWAEKELRELKDQSADPARPGAWRGQFGVFVSGATAYFDNARIALHESH
jgi:hypothetical protein